MANTPHEPNDHGTSDSDMFEVVWRGYDKDQVHARVQGLAVELAAARDQVELLKLDLRRAQAEKANEQQNTSANEASNSFGHRVEKILRMADFEAAEIRSKATDEAAGLMEKARVEAETYRHDVEQQLITRASNLDQEAARRNATLQEREAEVAAELAAAVQRAEELRDDAERESERMRQNAEHAAQQVRTQAEKAAQQQRDAAKREVNQLSKVQEEVRSEIRRLHSVLATELGRSPVMPTQADGSEGERGRPQARRTSRTPEAAEEPAENELTDTAELQDAEEQLAR